jgi:hypothetical protein
MPVPILAVACITVMHPTIEKVQLSTPEGRRQVLQNLGRKVDAGTLTYNELKGFDKRLKDYERRYEPLHARVLALGAIKDDEERRKAAEQLSKELREMKKEWDELWRGFDGIAARAKERQKGK